MIKSLMRFAIVPDGDRYGLHLEVCDGEPIELSVSLDQLDLLAEEIDRRLETDEEVPLPPSVYQ